MTLYGSPQSDHVNDVIEYWFGAYLTNDDAGTGDDGMLFPVEGIDTLFGGLSWMFGGDSANNQDHSNFLMGCGLEGIDGASTRAQGMGRAMSYLLTRP